MREGEGEGEGERERETFFFKKKKPNILNLGVKILFVKWQQVFMNKKLNGQNDDERKWWIGAKSGYFFLKILKLGWGKIKKLFRKIINVNNSNE